MTQVQSMKTNFSNYTGEQLAVIHELSRTTNEENFITMLCSIANSEFLPISVEELEDAVFEYMASDAKDMMILTFAKYGAKQSPQPQLKVAKTIHATLEDSDYSAITGTIHERSLLNGLIVLHATIISNVMWSFLVMYVWFTLAFSALSIAFFWYANIQYFHYSLFSRPVGALELATAGIFILSYIWYHVADIVDHVLIHSKPLSFK